MISRNRWLLAVVVLLAFVVLGVASSEAQDPPAEKKPLFKAESRGWTESLAFTPDNQRVACDLVLRDLAGKELAKGDIGEFIPCMHVAFSPDGKRFASVHFDDGMTQARHEIRLWDVTADNKLKKVATLQPKKEPRTAHRRSMYYLTFSPDSSLLATREQDDSTVVWDTATGKEKLRLDTQGLAVCFAADGRTLTTVTRDSLVQHWDLTTKKCVAAPEAKREDYLFVQNAIASADGKTLALVDYYSAVIKDAQSGKTLRRFDNIWAGSPALSADGKTLAVTNSHGAVLLDRESGKEVAHLKERDSWALALAFSQDGKSLAVATSEPERRYSVAVWEIAKLSARKGEVKRDPPPTTIEVKLTSKKDVYPLSLDGKTPEAFAKLVGKGTGSLPPSPKVDLVLTIRNTGTKPLTIEGDVLLSFHLTGDGAMNHPGEIYQTEGRFDKERKKVTLAPGKTHEIPIQSLDRGGSEQSYWLLPGEYTLHAGCFFIADPAPAGAEKLGDTAGFVTLNAPPLRVKVVAEKK